jgi:pimeloyl-[acyl-carrier protein] methyl ester esterase
MTSTLFSESRGQGPNLVLLHGWGLNSGVWEPISSRLEAHFRVTFIDLPGFGRNASIMPEHYDLTSISSMVGECLPDKYSLLGWSMGGLVAQNIAIDHASNIDKLVLLATSPKFTQDADWFGIKSQVLTSFEDQLEKNYSKTLDRFMAIQALGSTSAREDIKQIKQFIEHYPMPDYSALRAGLGILAGTDLRPFLADISCETYRLYGRLDSLVPTKAIARIAELQPNSKSHTFAHASHAPFISHPDDFLGHLFTIFDIEEST